jgi:hypothetical protein
LGISITKQSPPLLLIVIVFILIAFFSLQTFRYHILSNGPSAYKIDRISGEMWFVTPHEIRAIKQVD